MYPSILGPRSPTRTRLVIFANKSRFLRHYVARGRYSAYVQTYPLQTTYVPPLRELGSACRLGGIGGGGRYVVRNGRRRVDDPGARQSSQV